MADGIDDGSVASHTMVATQTREFGQAVLGESSGRGRGSASLPQGAKQLSSSPRFQIRLISTPYFLST